MDKRFALGAVIAVLALAFIGASFTGFFSLPAGQEELKVGLILPLSGSNASGGKEAQKGFLVALEEINLNGGINGKKIAAIIEDDKSTVKDSVNAFEKLANADSIDFVIGGYTSDITLANAPIAESKKVVFLVLFATSARIDDAGEYIFKFQVGNEGHVEKISKVMEENGFKKIGFIYLNNEFCKDYSGFFDIEFGKKGLQKVAEETYEASSKDARSQLLKLQAAGPDAIFTCGYYEDQGIVVKQAKELGIENQFFSAFTVQNKTFLEIAGNAAEGIIYTNFSFNCNNEKEFCEKYEKMFGEKPSYRSAYGYDALRVIAKAIEKAGPDPEAVKEELLKTDYNGLTGHIAFNEKGNIKRGVALMIIRNGQFVPLE